MIRTQYFCDVCKDPCITITPIEIKLSESSKTFDFCDKCLEKLNIALDIKNDIEVLGKEASIKVVNLVLREYGSNARIDL